MKHSAQSFCLAALMAACGSMSTALADSSALPGETQMTEQKDGTLVPQPLNGVSIVAVRYAHHPKLVASNCLTLEQRQRPGRDFEHELVNHCTHAVALAYCVDDMQAGKRACEAMGHRKIATQRIDAGAGLRLGREAIPNSDLNWVACRSEAKAVSLTNEGTRGECLGEVPQVAAVDPTIGGMTLAVRAH